MAGVRMIELMHPQCLAVVIDGDVHRSPHSSLDAPAGAATASEVVHDHLVE
jgi:hypothetical protein